MLTLQRVLNQSEIEFLQKFDSERKPAFKHEVPIYTVKGSLGSMASFGEIALSYTNRRTATIVAAEDSYVLSLSKKAF